MEFLRKLFKALNSAQHPWQVTLAITLGMIAGLTPVGGTQTLLILFIVFLFNVHIGLFFAASALFAGIGYLFDPWMEAFGFWLLTSEGMKELYTAWYNNGLMRLSHFNNTLVMGATVLSLLLALPLFFGLNYIISLYRERIAGFLNANRYLSRLGIFKVSVKKEPVLRWWGAGLYVAVFGVIAALLLLVVDPLLKWGIEKGASKLLKRDVRVASVETRLFEGAVGINRIEVAGKKADIDAVSIDNIVFDLDMNALLLSKTHIEKMEVSGVGFQTEATMKKRYGDTEKESVPETGAATEAKSLAIPSIDLPTPKELLAKADLTSDKVFEEAQKEIAMLQQKWKKIQKEQLSGEALERYRSDLKQMQSDAGSKDPAKMLALTEQVAAYNKALRKQKKMLETLKREYQEDQKRLKALLAEVKEAPQADYARLCSTYTLDAGGGINLFGLLFSQKIARYLELARGYYAQVEPYLQREAVPEERPPRGEGRWVRFAESVPSPDLWIARTVLSGEKRAQKFEGLVNDISDDQKALGRPLTLSVNSDGPLVHGLHLEGEDNRLGESAFDRVAFKAGAIAMGRLDLEKMTIDNSRLGLEGVLTLYDTSRLVGAGSVAFSEADIMIEGLGGKGAQIINDLLAEIRRFGADVKVEGDWSSPSVTVDSDLDKKISAAFKKVVAKEADQYTKELKGLMDGKVREQTEKLSGMTQGFGDTGKLLEQQSLSLDALEEQAKGLLGSKKSPDKLKKLLKF